MKKLLLSAAFLMLICPLINSSLHASLLYYDGFDYTSGTTVGASASVGPNGGTGWGTSTHWYDNSDATNRYTVTSSGLSYGSLTTVGNALSQANDTIGAFRSFNNSNTTLADGTYYVSFLYNISGNSASTATSGVYAGLQIGGGYVGLATANAGSTDRALVLSSGYASSNVNSTGVIVNTTGTTTYLLVLKIDFSAANADTFSLWVNPITSDEASAGAAQASSTAINGTTMNSVNFYSSTTLFGMTVDELRIGTTWADVTSGLSAVPEPGSLSLAALSMLALIGRARLRSRLLS